MKPAMTAQTAQLSLAENRRIQREGGFCPMCVRPRQIVVQDGVTYKYCPVCKDAQEVQVSAR